MTCQRCLIGKEATYRAYTEAMEMEVCRTCADEAQRLGIAVEILDPGERKNGAKSYDDTHGGWRRCG